MPYIFFSFVIVFLDENIAKSVPLVHSVAVILVGVFPKYL